MKQFSKINTLTLLLFIILYVITINIFADSTFHFKQKVGQNQDKGNSVYIKAGKIRFSESDAQNGEYSIFDSNKSKLIHVNPARKAYIEMDQNSMDEQIRAMQAQMEKMRQQMQQQMENMPPEQRQMMEQMMSQEMDSQMSGVTKGPKQKQIKTAKTEIIAGVKCEVIEIRIGSALKEELCISDENQFDIDLADKKTISNLKLFMKNISRKAESMMGGQPVVEQFDGLPIRTRHYNTIGKLVYETTLSSISKNRINIDRLSIPANYSRQRIAQGF